MTHKVVYLMSKGFISRWIITKLIILLQQEESLFGAPFMFDLEDELNGEDADKQSSFVDSTSQSNHIKNTLLNMMDEEPAETTQFGDPKLKPAAPA